MDQAAHPPRITRWRTLMRVVTAGALALTALSPSAQDLRIGGTGSALGAMQGLAQLHARQAGMAPISVLPSLGSSDGIKAVLSGVIQIGLSSRPLSDTELRAGAVRDFMALVRSPAGRDYLVQTGHWVK